MSTSVVLLLVVIGLGILAFTQYPNRIAQAVGIVCIVVAAFLLMGGQHL